MFILSCKSILSQSNDSISIKTAKLAISSFIPIVGATVNDALRTVVSSITLVKNSCGIIALLAIGLMMLPQIVSLLLFRLLFNITSAMAKCLNCDNECSIIEEASGVCGFLLALVLCTSILFIFAISIMIKSTVVI
jgi:stage III sporulation protein AE